MINQQDFNCGTLLAPIHVTFPKSSIMAGLEELFSLNGEPCTFKSQITEQCQDPETSKLMEEVATHIGTELRTAAERIKEHVIPTLGRIVQEVNGLADTTHILQKTVDQLKVRYAKIDHPFFLSPLYPTETKNKTLSFHQINVDNRMPVDLLSVDLGSEQVSPFQVNHPDIVRFLNTESELVEAIVNAHDRNWWMDHFGTPELSNGDCHFNRVGSYDLVNIFRVYVVLSRIRSQLNTEVTESELLPIRNISLRDYTQLINDLWEGLNVYLPALKGMCKMHAKNGLVILGRNPFSLVKQDIKGVEFEVLKGNCNVLYTQDIADRIELNETSLAEVTYNYILHIIKNKGIPKVTAISFVDGSKKLNEGTELSYLLGCNTCNVNQHTLELIVQVAREVFRKKLLEMGIEEFSLKNINTDSVGFGWVDVVGLEVEGHTASELIMNGCLGSELLGLLGYENARELLREVGNAIKDGHLPKKAVGVANVIVAMNLLTRSTEED